MKEKKQKKGRLIKSVTGVIAGVLALSMVVGVLQPATETLAAGKTANIDGFSAVYEADLHTSDNEQIFNGSPAEDGKIWTDKSVATGAIYGVNVGEENIGVALSALAQTYNTVATSLDAEEKLIAYDVVFVIDFSGSMNDPLGDETRAAAMVRALNQSITTLMEAENNRVAVVKFSGTTVEADNNDLLLDLARYESNLEITDAETNTTYKEYFRYNAGNEVITTPAGVTLNGTQVSIGNQSVDGGTPTQEGIYDGMQVFLDNEKPDDDVTRIPIMVLLTDGSAGVARSNYTTLSGGTNYSGSSNGGYASRDPYVGAYTVLTANYAKDQVDALYKERYNNDSAMKFYTIGLGIEENTWSHFMLNPSITVENDDDINTMTTTIEDDTTYGTDYQYADEYYGGDMTAADLENAFQDIMDSLQVIPQYSSTVNDPIVSEGGGGAAGSTMKFTDYLGYKMELKGGRVYLRYGGVNYRFDEQADGSYTFSGYDQAGNAVLGPVITRGETTYTLRDVIFRVDRVDEEYNGQRGYNVITWEFPSALLPTYSRLNDYDSSNVEPIRLLYETGLEEDADLLEDSLKIDADGKPTTNEDEIVQYAFYSNLYDFATPHAMSWSEYTPSKDNPYYYETGYSTDSEMAGTDAPYIRLDIVNETVETEMIDATAHVELTDISTDVDNAAVTFVYNGRTYTVNMSGDPGDGAVWTGSTTIPVSATAATGQTIDQFVSVRVEATYTYDSFLGYIYNEDLDVSGVWIKNESATLSANNTIATSNNLIISQEFEVEGSRREELVTVYLPLESETENGETNYFVTLSNDKRIDVTEIADGQYQIKLGEDTYSSNIYYKYAEGTTRYTEREFEKGTVPVSLIGKFNIDQPDSADFELTEENFGDVFTYTTSDGDTFKATRATFSDGIHWGDETVGDTLSIPKGSFNLCIDGIINSIGMTIHFDFVVEEQTLADGTKRYNVLNCSYWENPEETGGNTYSVDVTVSDLPEIADNGDYTYDVSYTIINTHADSSVNENANRTQTDPHFLHTHFNTNGTVAADLGNNGRLAVAVADTYEYDITVEKRWQNRIDEEISIDDLPDDIEITVGLYQEYSYVDEKGETVTAKGTSGETFDTVILNKANGFTYTWEGNALPKYLVNSGGDYVLDINGAQVPVKYTVAETIGADGWQALEEVEIITSDEDGTQTMILTNVPLAEFEPSVRKVWTEDGEEAAAPTGYAVEVTLYANDQPVTNPEKLDTAHTITATLTQADAAGDGTLSVKFGDIAVETTETVAIADFTAANTQKEYTFTVNNPTGGEAGTGAYAHTAQIVITVANTFGDKLGISDAELTYLYNEIGTGEPKEAVLSPHSSHREEDTAANTKTVTFLMSYNSEGDTATVVLDGVVDEFETTPWFYTWADWNLPLLSYDEETGHFEQINYTVKETLLIPDGAGNYTEYPVDEATGLIKDTDGNILFKATTTNDNAYNFTITNDENVTAVTAEKVWVDNDNAYETRPDQITFSLKNGETEVPNSAKVITADNDLAGVWNGTANVEWTDLPKYDEDGNQITYTVEETLGTLPTADKYEFVVTADETTENHYIVTNSLYADPAINSTFVEVDKEWIDNNNAYGTRPTNLYMVIFHRLDGSTADPEMVPLDTEFSPLLVLNASNEWKGGWDGLPKYNENGVKWNYTVKEYEDPDPQNPKEFVTGYNKPVTPAETTIERDGNTGTAFSFTNQLEDGSISKTVTKVWRDAALDPSTRQDVTVVLSGTITTADGTLDVDLTDYETTQTLTGDSWSYTWENLPEYSEGIKIDYTVEETHVGTTEVVSGAAGDYTVAVRDDGTGNDFVVTNTLTGTTTVSVEKEWVDFPDETLKTEVTFDILNRNAIAGSLVVNSGNNWEATSEALPKYDANGAVINYTISEQQFAATEEYRIDSVIGTNTGTDGHFVYQATNTYVSLLQDIEGTKTWQGVTGDNIPDYINVQLFQDDATEAFKTIEVRADADGNWKYVFEDVPIYKDGNVDTPHVYTVKESGITKGNTTWTAEYTSATVGTAGDYTIAINGYNITNTLGGTVDGADLDGTKTWDLTQDANGVVPDSIEVQLMRSISGGAIEEAVDVDGVKVDAITVTKDGQDNGQVWTYDFEGETLPKYDADGNEYIYSVKEISVTAGTTTQTVVYTDDTTGTVGDWNVVLSGRDITNTLKAVEGDDPKDTSVTFPMEKEWITPPEYAMERPTSIRITVTGTAGNEIIKYDGYDDDNVDGVDDDDVDGDGVDDGIVLEWSIRGKRTEGLEVTDNAWLYTFEDLRKYADDGITEYVYSIEEIYVGDKKVVLDEEEGKLKAEEWTVTYPDAHTIVNSREVNLEDITVTKIWEGVSGDNIPDSITVQLYQQLGEDGMLIPFGIPTEITKTANANLDNDNNDATWSYTYEGLPTSRDGTDEYIYTVQEVSVTADGVTEMVDRTTNPAKVMVGDYVVTENGYVITNTLNDDDTDNEKIKVSYPVEKIWVDAAGQIPDNITIQLMQDGEDVGEYTTGKSGEVILNKDEADPDETQWEYTYTELNKYTDNGITQHVYTAKETKIESVVVTNGKAGDFFVTYTQQDGEKTIINNRLADEDTEKELTTYGVEKNWQDAEGNPLTENLPESITVELYQAGTAGAFGSQVITADDDWKYTFTNLPKYQDDGLTPYEYSIKETKIGSVAVSNGTAGAFEVTVDGNTITNKLTGTTTTDITVTKVWEGINDEDNIPDAIRVQLDGGSTTEYANLTAANAKADDAFEWTYKFNVPKYEADNITEIDYVAREISVTEGSVTRQVVYTGESGTVGDYTVTNLNNLTIQNTLAAADDKEETEYAVTKIWDVPAGTPLPESITVDLYRAETADGQKTKVATKVITVTDDWKHTFTELPKYTDNGITEYIYSVQESKIGNVEVVDGKAGGFVVTVDGNEIENAVTDITADLFTSLSGTKTWEGVSGDNIPDSITIELYRDGAYYDQKVVTGTGKEWSYEFDNLPRFKDGVTEYVYTVKESAIAGYGNVTYTNADNTSGTAGDYTVVREGTNFTNTLGGTIEELEGKKIWADAGNEALRPANITVELYRGIEGGTAQKIAEQAVNGSGNEWTFTFNNANKGYPKYDANGNEYIYTVKEKGEVNGLYSIKNGNTLINQYRVTYDQENLSITNATPNAGTAVISGTKTMTGRTFIADDVFQFQLKAVTADAPMPTDATATLNGQDEAETLQVAFGTITYTKEGTYKYTVEEIEGSISGVTYDDTVWNVTVDVVYSTEEEKYVTTVTYGNDEDNEGFAFTNSYEPTSLTLDGATNLVVQKVFTGREDEQWLNTDEFRFTLEATGDTVAKVGTTVFLPEETTITVTEANKDGASFGDIVFEETGVYTFAIREVNDHKEAIKYDDHVMQVTVTVTDNNRGKLQAAAVDYIGSNVFTNSYSATPVTATISGTKTMTGRELNAQDSFSFKISAITAGAPMPAQDTVTHDADGKIQFAPITFTEPGVYRYKIVEVEPTDGTKRPGVAYDKSEIEAVVTVTDNHVGALSASVSYVNDDSVFVNEYSATATYVSLSAAKEIEDISNSYTLEAGNFTFKITPAASNPTSDPISQGTVTNDANGNIVLAENAKYTEGGVYYYDITEESGTEAGITYDDTVYTVKVTITDTNAVLDDHIEILKDGVAIENGTLDDIQFVNEYTPDAATAVISGKKEFTGEKPLTAGMFTFELLDENGTQIDTATNDETGVFQFDTITYTTADTYEYKVKEVIPAGATNNNNGTYTLNGITYVATEYPVTVTVSNPSQTAAVEETLLDDEALSDAETPLDDEALSDEETLLDDETLPDEASLLDDEIPVPQAEEATLYAAVTYGNGADSSLIITNSYEPEEVSIGEGTNIPLSGTKELTGRSLQTGEFEFVIEAAGNAPEPTKATDTNAADGDGDGKASFGFGTIEFDETGTYYYTITEKNNRIPGIVYDTGSYTVKVDVTDEGYDGQLDAEVTYYSGPETEADEVIFRNSYQAASTSARLSVTKQLTGRALKAGEFSFTITPVTEGAPMPAEATAKNDATGVALFDEMVFTEAAEYKYQVTEVNTGAAGVTYDTTVYDVVVTVTDDGNGYLVPTLSITNAADETDEEISMVFINTYEKPEEPAKEPEKPGKDPEPEEPKDDEPVEFYPVPTPPEQSPGAGTGDSANIVGLFGLAAIAVAGFAGITVYKRRKNNMF